MGVNLYMRIINGNTSSHGFRICFLNPDGVMGKTRGPAITSLDADLMVLSETHLTSELMKIVDGSFPKYRKFWGAPNSKAFSCSRGRSLGCSSPAMVRWFSLSSSFSQCSPSWCFYPRGQW